MRLLVERRTPAGASSSEIRGVGGGELPSSLTSSSLSSWGVSGVFLRSRFRGTTLLLVPVGLGDFFGVEATCLIIGGGSFRGEDNDKRRLCTLLDTGDMDMMEIFVFF